jgi:uncharacterized protein Veg
MGISTYPAASAANPSDNWQLISSVSASGSSVSFTSISGYKKLMLRGANLACSSNGSWYVRLNSDSGSKYDYSYEYANYGAADKYNVTSAVAATSIGFPSSGSDLVNVFLTISNTDTTGIKTITGALGTYDATYSYRGTNLIGNYIASASISTVTLTAGSSGMAGTVSLYGVLV